MKNERQVTVKLRFDRKTHTWFILYTRGNNSQTNSQTNNKQVRMSPLRYLRDLVSDRGKYVTKVELDNIVPGVPPSQTGKFVVLQRDALVGRQAFDRAKAYTGRWAGVARAKIYARFRPAGSAARRRVRPQCSRRHQRRAAGRRSREQRGPEMNESNLCCDGARDKLLSLTYLYLHAQRSQYTGQRNSKGRVIYAGPRGGLYVMEGGRKIRVRNPPAAAPHTNLARRVVQGAARRQAAAYAMAVVMGGATAATGHKRRPRGMSGSGLPFARHEGLEGRPFASNFMHDEPFALRKAVRVGPHAFSKTNLRRMLNVNPRAVNPMTRQRLPPAVVNALYQQRHQNRQNGSLQASILQNLVKAARFVEAAAARRAGSSSMVSMVNRESRNGQHAVYTTHADGHLSGVLLININEEEAHKIFINHDNGKLIMDDTAVEQRTQFGNALQRALADYNRHHATMPIRPV